jgi:hypothetical protein
MGSLGLLGGTAGRQASGALDGHDLDWSLALELPRLLAPVL